MDRSEICYYASKYDADYDTPMCRLAEDVKERGYLKMTDLLTLSIWMTRGQTTRYIKKNVDGVVEEMTKWSLAAETERDRIDYLCRLDGVRLGVASAILHWFHNEDYPIHSRPALKTVGVEKKHCSHRFGEWMRYVLFCQRIAEENRIEMRTLDRALWQYSKEQSKKRRR